MAPRYRVTLTAQERKELEELTRNGKTPAKKFIHARALLLCDASLNKRGQSEIKPSLSAIL